MKSHFSFLLTLSLLLLTQMEICAQSFEFPDIYLEPDTVRSGIYKGLEAYDLGYMVLYKKSKKADNFKIMDKSTDVELFTFKTQKSNTHFTKPKFFRSEEKNQPIIIMVDESNSYSLGVQVFLIDDSGIHHIGFLKYAADNFNFSSLALYSHFKGDGSKIILTVDDVDIIDLAAEEIIKGGTLKFEISEDSIRKID